jgi:hypothetical protein
MDEYIIGRITEHLSSRDLAMFAQVNKLTYQYCKHTNINRQLCKTVVHNTYHYVPTLLEQAKLDYCMTCLQDVCTLSTNKIPMQKFRIAISLWKPCGARIDILIGRCIVINRIVYAFSPLDYVQDSLNKTMKDVHTVLVIRENMERLLHKMNSIISHRYEDIHIKTFNILKTGFNRELVDGLEHIHKLYRFFQLCG